MESNGFATNGNLRKQVTNERYDKWKCFLYYVNDQEQTCTINVDKNEQTNNTINLIYLIKKEEDIDVGETK